MNKEKPINLYEWLPFIIFFALIGGLLVVGDSNARYITLAVLLLVVAFYFSVLIHELGHLIASLYVGYPFSVFAVGLFQVYRDDDDQLRFGLRQLAWQPANLLGFVLFKVDFADFRRRMTLVVAAGPLANALLMVVSGVFSLGANGFPSYDLYLNNPLAWMLSVFNALLFGSSLFLLVMALYPSEWVSTDGHKLARLLRGGAILERFKAHMQIVTAIMQGARPRDWNATWLDPLLALNDGSVDMVHAHTLTYRWALDHGAEARAEAYLTTAVKFRHKVSPPERIDLLIEAAYVEMRYHANTDNARVWMKSLSAERKRAQPVLRLRLACTANLILRRYPEAREIAYQAIRALDRAGAEDGLSIMERDLFRDIIQLVDLADEMKANRSTTTEAPPPTE